MLMVNIKHRLTPHPVKIRAGKETPYMYMYIHTMLDVVRISGYHAVEFRKCTQVLDNQQTSMRVCMHGCICLEEIGLPHVSLNVLMRESENCPALPRNVHKVPWDPVCLL